MEILFHPLVLYLIFSIIFATLCMYEAQEVGWDPIVGVGLGLAFGPIAYIALLIVKNKQLTKTEGK